MEDHLSVAAASAFVPVDVTSSRGLYTSIPILRAVPTIPRASVRKEISLPFLRTSCIFTCAPTRETTDGAKLVALYGHQQRPKSDQGTMRRWCVPVQSHRPAAQ